jgi:hypothetical protein
MSPLWISTPQSRYGFLHREAGKVGDCPVHETELGQREGVAGPHIDSTASNASRMAQRGLSTDHVEVDPVGVV